MQSANLAPVTVDSPGSSVFDLPVHQQDNSSTVQSTACSPSSQQTETEHEGLRQSLTDVNGQSFLVVSGGTGCNSICSAFGENACYVLPVSDDGGSSSEIIRVLGGPSIGICDATLFLLKVHEE